MADPIAESKGFPADLGVFAEPKDAKAPEPRPNALDAPVVGEVTPPPGVELNGLGLSCDGVSTPGRLPVDALREEASMAEAPLAPLLDVDKDNLALLKRNPC
jgi:hypothetical protein